MTAGSRSKDETPFYRRFADTLKLIGLHDDRTWLLKNSDHYGHLDSLFAMFPDARVVVTHRDPIKSIPSLCSVLEHAHRLIDPQADLTKIDPIGVVRRLYGHFGLELPQVERDMRAWLQANPTGKHGEHRYTLDRYGISADEIRAEFGEG
jgi:hypothetical protein